MENHPGQNRILITAQALARSNHFFRFLEEERPERRRRVDFFFAFFPRRASTRHNKKSNTTKTINTACS